MGSKEQEFALALVLILMALGAFAVMPTVRLVSGSLNSKNIRTDLLKEQYAGYGAADRAFCLPTRFLRRTTLFVSWTYGSRSVSSLPRHLSRKVGFHLRNQRGSNLIEVLIAVGILGLIGPAILLFITTSNRTIQR